MWPAICVNINQHWTKNKYYHTMLHNTSVKHTTFLFAIFRSFSQNAFLEYALQWGLVPVFQELHYQCEKTKEKFFMWYNKQSNYLPRCYHNWPQHLNTAFCTLKSFQVPDPSVGGREILQCSCSTDKPFGSHTHLPRISVS